MDTWKIVTGTKQHVFVFPMIALILAVIVSCSEARQNPKVTYANYMKIAEGIPKEEVIRILGEPDSSLKSRPCKCADIETMSYLSGKIGIDVKIFNKKVCEKNYVDFAKYEIRE